MTDALIELIWGQVDAQTDAMCAQSGILPLGELAARLAACPESLPVVFSDGGAQGALNELSGGYPGRLMSYRGYYRYIAVDRSREPKTVGTFRREVEAAIGATFVGYKGGDFTMTRFTPVWVSEYGTASGDGIVAVEQFADAVRLLVQRVDED